MKAICFASSYALRYSINCSRLIDGLSFKESVLLTNLYSVFPAINWSKSSYHELATAGRLVSTKTFVTPNRLTKSYADNVLPNRGFAFHKNALFS